MENSSTTKWKRQLVPSAKSRTQATDTSDHQGNNHLVEARAEDGRRHEFSLDSLDKEILQTMSRGTSTKNTAPESASCESSGSIQEKVMCSPRPEPAAYVRTHSSESSSNTKKPASAQFQAPPLPVWPSGWPEGDARFNEYKQQVAVDVNGLGKQGTPKNHLNHHYHHHHHRPAAAGRGGTSTVTLDLKPNTPFRNLHSLTSRLDAACGEDHKQAMNYEGGGCGGGGPYSGSVGMFAYPGTPQRLFPGGQRTEDQANNIVVAVGSPGFYERSVTALHPGGQSQQRSGTKSKVTPSKWDDAGKWIASPGHSYSGVSSENARSPPQGLVNPSPFLLPGMRLPVAGKVVVEARTESNIPSLMDASVTSSAVIESDIPSLMDSSVTSSTDIKPDIPSLMDASVTSSTVVESDIPSLMDASVTSSTVVESDIPSLIDTSVTSSTVVKPDIPSLMDASVTSSTVIEPDTPTPTEVTPESPLHKTTQATCTESPNTKSSSVRVKDHIKQIESAIQCSIAKLASPPTSTDPAVKRSVRAVPAAKSSGAWKDTSVITSTMYVQRPKDSRLDAMISPPSLLVDLKAHQAQNNNPFGHLPAEPKPPLVAVLTTPPPPPPEAPVEGPPPEAPVKPPPPPEAPVKPPPPPEIPVKAPPPEAPVKAPPSPEAAVKDIFSNAGTILVRESATDTANPAYRDMGTQMTPNPSVRLPRGTTFMLSPTRCNTSDHSWSEARSPDVKIDWQSCQLQGGRRNHPSAPHPTLDQFTFKWSTREEEDAESAACLRGGPMKSFEDRDAHGVASPYVVWAAAWEEAERAKYTARFHQEEAKIQAWEDHQKAKAETQMRKTETKLEKMHERASQKMFGKIAAAHKKAEDMRVAAEACCEELASKAKRRAEIIRHTGNVPSTLGCFTSRLVPFQSTLQ